MLRTNLIGFGFYLYISLDFLLVYLINGMEYLGHGYSIYWAKV